MPQAIHPNPSIAKVPRLIISELYNEAVAE
jgi:hypothetical protein